MVKDNRYTINSNYLVKNDQARVLLCYRHNPNSDLISSYYADKNFFSYIHPDHAKLFSSFDGTRTLSQVISKVAKKISTDEVRAEQLLMPYIENEKRLSVTYRGNTFIFPANFIVPVNEHEPLYTYKEDDFNCNYEDFRDLRLKEFPIDVTLMVGTICLTDCIYCYADCRKKMNCQIPTRIIEQLIDDCKKNHVRAFDLMGGEVLKYKNWRWLIRKMIDSSYVPYISTKMPLEKSVIHELKDFGINLFQISLDSFKGNILEKNLNITNGDHYIHKMEASMKHFENAEMRLNVHAVITKHNKEIDHLRAYLDKLTVYNNINNVQVSIAADSLYKDNFTNYRLTRQEADTIAYCIDEVKSQYPFGINLSKGYVKEQFINDRNVKQTAYTKRGLCSANLQRVYILPTGDVSICEELMFHPQFFLGNLMKEDLQTIWKNNRLKYLEDIRFYSGSRCGKCKEFGKCKVSGSQGVCWKDVLHAYGDDKWHYPDPKCPYAPTKMRPFYLE
jgi:MoaA/NifB/PqqE/SkfB family radical SAM enzyme